MSKTAKIKNNSGRAYGLPRVPGVRSRATIIRPGETIEVPEDYVTSLFEATRGGERDKGQPKYRGLLDRFARGQLEVVGGPGSRRPVPSKGGAEKKASDEEKGSSRSGKTSKG